MSVILISFEMVSIFGHDQAEIKYPCLPWLFLLQASFSLNVVLQQQAPIITLIDQRYGFEQDRALASSEFQDWSVSLSVSQVDFGADF